MSLIKKVEANINIASPSKQSFKSNSAPSAKINSASDSIPSQYKNSYSPETMDFDANESIFDIVSSAIEEKNQELEEAEKQAEAAKLQAGTSDDLMKERVFNLIAEKIGGGIDAEYGIGMQGFCIVDDYIVMAVVVDDRAKIYLVDKNTFQIYDSIDIGENHANVLSYDPVDKVVFVGNTGQLPVTLGIKDNQLSQIENKCKRKGQVLYNEQNDLFIVTNGTSDGTTTNVYTREQFYDSNSEPSQSFIMPGLDGYGPQGKTTYGNHIYFCLSKEEGENAIAVYNINTGQLEQTIYDDTKKGTNSELEQAYFDEEGNMHTNYNNGNEIYKTNYNYYEQVK